ncbi:DNA-cytosine methylase (Dcm) [Fructobacillus tropaeoli]|uniref:DNA cytosine methyltransferase n=1 Tax=Fructobacillus tropaeoli TaxID=709323 RepID=UPI002DABB2B8|nr:DNA-cytosine methylase (Dcm) [Fructobacillus tropaeoli]
MKFIDIFAGIGGFRSGMELAGHECVGYIEFDKFARKSYEAIYDTTGEFTAWDINEVNADEIPESDVWCFGFPCQDISLAGNKKGFNGDKSSLFFAVTGILRQKQEKDRPKYLFVENVKNLLSINKGRDFARLLIELDEIGYDVQWRVIDSKHYVAQHRERVYIVANLRRKSGQEILPIGRVARQVNQANLNQVGNVGNLENYGGNPQTGRIYSDDGVSPTLNTMQGGGKVPKVLVRQATKSGYDEAKPGESVNVSQPNSKTRRGRVGHQIANTLTTQSEQAVLLDDYKIRMLTPRECWRLQGFTDEQFDKAKEVNSNSQLYKQAGNSVTVPVMAELAKLFV